MKSALFIEPDRAARASLALALEKAGWQTHQADDAESGLQIAARHHPQVLVCAVHLSGQNGFQVCRAMREAGYLASPARIILVSASEYAIDRLSAVEAGADDFWIKPLSLEHIEGRLDRLRETDRGRAPVPKVAFGSVGPQAAVPFRPPQPAATTLVRFWGVRGSIPVPGPDTAFYGGNTACVEVRAGGRIIILDGGSGIRPLGTALMNEARGLGVECDILISHMHWDHIMGLAFFAPGYDPQSRIRIFGFPNAERGLHETLAMLMRSPYFPIDWRQLPSQIEVHELPAPSLQLGSTRVQAAWMNHPGICAGYRLDTIHGSVAYLPDHEPFQRYVATVAGGRHADDPRLEFAAEQNARLRRFIQDCDLLIVDSQYDSREYPEYVGWGHGCAADAVNLALSAGVRQVCLFHHDPSHDDSHLTRMAREAQEAADRAGGKLVVHCAREGLEIALG
jgi:phosphoribosyl 1,2-cyclic phosphodiesterase/ActR/RegA family two-component response regulator